MMECVRQRGSAEIDVKWCDKWMMAKLNELLSGIKTLQKRISSCCESAARSFGNARVPQKLHSSSY